MTNTTLTPEQIAEIRQRQTNAPRGPWTIDVPEDEMSLPEKRVKWLKEWAAQARTDIPALCDSHDSQVARIAELERENERLKADRERKWDAEGLLASCTDHANSFARAADVLESPNEAGLRALIDRLWAVTSTRIYDLTAQLAQRDKALAEVLEAFDAYKNSPSHVGGYPRWLEDEIHQCRIERSGQMCDSEDLCNAHAAKAAALGQKEPGTRHQKENPPE